MKCGRCGNENSSTARFCARCGTSLSSGSLLNRLETSIWKRPEGRYGNISRRLKASISAQIAQYSSPLRSTAKPAAPAGSRSLMHPMEMLSLLLPMADQIMQSKNIALSSPFIQGNSLYRSRIASVSFAYVEADDTVNAFATDHAIELADGRTLDPPAIAFLSGLAFTIRLIAAAVASGTRPREGCQVTETGPDRTIPRHWQQSCDSCR